MIIAPVALRYTSSAFEERLEFAGFAKEPPEETTSRSSRIDKLTRKIIACDVRFI